MKKEIPILYSTAMVQAKIAGRKKMTRRVVKQLTPEINIHYLFENDGKHYRREAVNGAVELGFRCPYGSPGDLHWIREKFVSGYQCNEGSFQCDEDDNLIPFVRYAADGKDFEWYDGTSDFPAEKIPWKPSIHMPKAIARIWEEVVSVRIERLQDITEEDAIAEGVLPIRGINLVVDVDTGEAVKGNGDLYKHYLKNTHACLTARESFQTLWTSINGPGSWESNPWVWVVETKTISLTGKPEIA